MELQDELLNNVKQLIKEKAVHNFTQAAIFAILAAAVGFIIGSPPFVIFLLAFTCVFAAFLATMFDLSFLSKFLRRYVEEQAKQLAKKEQARKDAFFNATKDTEKYDA